MSNWSPAAKSIYFLVFAFIFYGINIYHYPDNVSVLPEFLMMTMGVMIGFFAEAARTAKVQILLWATSTASMCISILIASIEITSSPLDLTILLTPGSARLALMMAIFNIMWIVYNRVWDKVQIFRSE